MPTIPTCLIADVAVQTPNRLCKNRLYFTADAPPTGVSDMQGIADVLFVELSPKYRILMPPTCKFHSVRVQWTAPTLDLEAFSSENPVAGTAANDALPDETCLEIQRRTSNRGRQNRGRILISGISEVYQENGKLTGPGKTHLKALALWMQSDVDASQTSFSFIHHRHWDRKANALDPVTQARAMDTFVSRRDRRRPLIPLPS